MAAQVVVVVGGGSGLGRLWAQRLADAGDEVWLADINEPGMRETASGRDSVRCVRCDITQAADVAALFAACGRPDRLILTAAIMPTAPATEDDMGRVERVMAINYLGSVRVLRAALDLMLPAKAGEIVVFGSVVAEAPTPHMSAYAASKAALNTYVEILQHEIANQGITVRLVLPPMTDTPLIEQARSTSNPRSMQLGYERNIVARPDEIIDRTQQAIRRGRQRIYPHAVSRALHWGRRLAPRLLWWVILRAERDG